MGYIKEFQERIKKRDFPKLLQLWEEYLTVDTTDAEELRQILLQIQKSDMHPLFGPFVETALPMWETIEDKEVAYRILKCLFDMETANSPQLADLATKVVTEKYGSHPHYKEGMRLVGLRDRTDFQGCLTNFDLLAHLGKGKFVFHTAGWGTGEIMDISLLREQLSIEFENVGGIKDLSIANAFKTLLALPSDSFLAQRFSNPDRLEALAKKEPLEVIKKMLIELGPKNANEIKEELIELVIPENDWAKWWQGVRTRLKKDPIIETPKSLKDPYMLRNVAKSVRDHLHEVLHHKEDLDEFIPRLYAFIRDVPNALKDLEVKKELEEGLLKALKDKETTLENGLQIALFLEQFFDKQVDIKAYVAQIIHPESVLEKVGVIALKKRVLQAIRKERDDWVPIFLRLLNTPQPSMIKEYLFTELLSSEKRPLLEDWLSRLLKRPDSDPETFFWVFQKVVSKEDFPFSDLSGRRQFLEGLLTLLSAVEPNAEHKELSKKIYQVLSQKRFLLVRQLIEGADRPFLEEFLLLASKCHSFPSHEQMILRSLVAVVDPSFKGQEKKKDRLNPYILWATQEGLDKMKVRIEHIGTVEVVDNAKEIEEARALGDLRENSEYKFALERRSRLQRELKHLSEQIQKARIITDEDIECDEIGIGNLVELVDAKGEKVQFTILGPWEANPEDHILSSQSQLAQEMLGKRLGDTIRYKNEEFSVKAISKAI